MRVVAGAHARSFRHGRMSRPHLQQLIYCSLRCVGNLPTTKLVNDGRLVAKHRPFIREVVKTEDRGVRSQL